MALALDRYRTTLPLSATFTEATRLLATALTTSVGLPISAAGSPT
jgi:hypothetical protein